MKGRGAGRGGRAGRAGTGRGGRAGRGPAGAGRRGRGRPPAPGARPDQAGRARTGSGPLRGIGSAQPIALSIVRVAASHAASGFVPRCSMLLICVEIASLIAPSFGPSTASGMDFAPSA